MIKSFSTTGNERTMKKYIEVHLLSEEQGAIFLLRKDQRML